MMAREKVCIEALEYGYGEVAFLGCILPNTRVDRASEIAKPIEMAVKFAARVDAADRPACEDIIAPMLPEASTSLCMRVKSALTKRGMSQERVRLMFAHRPARALRFGGE
jgi:hypothetical protein